MSIINDIVLTPTTQEIRAVGENKKVRLGTLKIHKGHTLFEINLKTKEINPASYESVDYEITTESTNQVRKKVIENKNCVYISALNENNALKKLMKKVNRK